MRGFVRTFAWVAVLLSPCLARGGASLLVDDTGTTPDGQCQVESWMRLRPGDRAETIVPACARAGVEYSLGASALGGAAPDPWLTLGLKHTLRDPGDGGTGFAMSLGSGWRSSDGRPAAVTADLIASVPLNEGLVMHLNLGWNAARGSAPAPGMGVGVQRDLGTHWAGLAEGFVERGVGFAWQGGLRRLFGHGASADLLLGHDPRGDWLTLGFNYAPGDS